MNFSRFTLFRNVRYKPKQFNYRPRYYKQDDEDLQRRKRAIEREVAREKGQDPGEYVPGNISFRRPGNRSNFVKRDIRKSTIRLLLIIGIIALAVIYLFKKVDTIFVN